jgi:hypothetical protein
MGERSANIKAEFDRLNKQIADLTTERDAALAKLHHFYDVCAKCEALLLTPNGPPRCEDCHLTDEQHIDWEHKAFALNGGYV